jgi:hypothetical protein
MRSDPRLQQALAALAQPIAEFRASVEGALAQADAYLDAHSATAAVRADRAGLELGAFAAGRVAPDRFAALFPPPGRADPVSLEALDRAVKVLREMASRGDELFIAEVTEGRKLGATVDQALAVAGRAFGAIVIAELVRAGRYVPEEHDRLLDAFEFRAWNRAERRFAPPLIVFLDGADLHAGALTDFADGREKLLLIVNGPAAPAPLVRCITPGTLVIQSVSGEELRPLSDFDGPAIAAIMPEGAAVFVHNPSGGEESWQRLALGQLPEAPKKAVGGNSAWQMAEDLRLLKELARTPFVVPTRDGPGVPAMGTGQAVDQLAAWLLGETGLPGGA